MRSAKLELLEIIENKAELKCAKIMFGYPYVDEERPTYRLKVDYNKKELEIFLERLNFEYDSGYGGQNLYGTVWLKDETWLSRGEYDGSELWEHNILPEIPCDII